MHISKPLILTLSLLVLSGCKLVDLQTKNLQETGIQASEIERGKALLAAAREAQGLDQMANYSTYRVLAEDQELLPSNAAELIGLAQALLQPGGNLAQDAVSDIVTVCVIDRLEKIHVQSQNAQRAPA